MDHKGHVVVVGGGLLQGLHLRQIKSFLFGSLGARCWRRALPAARRAERKPPRLRGARGLRHPAPRAPRAGRRSGPRALPTAPRRPARMPPPGPAPASLRHRHRRAAGWGRRRRGLDLADLAARANPNPAAGGGFPGGARRSHLSRGAPTSPRPHGPRPLAAPPSGNLGPEIRACWGFAATFAPPGAGGRGAEREPPLPLFLAPRAAKCKQDVPPRGQLRWAPSGRERLSPGPEQIALLGLGPAHRP